MAQTVVVLSLAKLLYLYSIYATEDYDINITTVECILTLRVVSIAYDYADGCDKACTKEMCKERKRERERAHTYTYT